MEKYIYIRGEKYLHAFTYVTDYLPKPPIKCSIFFQTALTLYAGG
jgi:hypothetical protein